VIALFGLAPVEFQLVDPTRPAWCEVWPNRRTSTSCSIRCLVRMRPSALLDSFWSLKPRPFCSSSRRACETWWRRGRWRANAAHTGSRTHGPLDNPWRRASHRIDRLAPRPSAYFRMLPMLRIGATTGLGPNGAVRCMPWPRRRYLRKLPRLSRCEDFLS